MKVLLIAILAALVPVAAFPQTSTLATPAPEEFPKGGFDRSSKIKVSGRIEKLDTLDGKPIFWVFATGAVQTGMGARVGAEVEGKGNLWRVEGTGVSSAKPPEKLVVGATVKITGDNADNKTCKPACRMRASRVDFD
jgi:hypothetical protein